MSGLSLRAPLSNSSVSSVSEASHKRLVARLSNGRSYEMRIQTNSHFTLFKRTLGMC
ncbi:hypothetical protein E4U58_000685 [Claviceps cyperi]|nr:hypothetical protein E4U58_000685 [Claviceps cyperi]